MTVVTIARDAMTRRDAQQLVNRINDSITDNWLLVVQAYSGRAWVGLGYDSWDALCKGPLRGVRMKMSPEDRQDVVERLRGRGLSMRAIGSAIGVSEGTVHHVLSGVQNRTPEPTAPAQVGQTDPPAPTVPLGSMDPSAAPAPVVGMDGKTYPPRAAKPPVDTTGQDLLLAEYFTQYPALAYYGSNPEKVISLGRTLDGFTSTELPGRLDTLDKTIAAEKARLAKPPEPETPDYYAMTSAMFDAANNLAQVIDREGGADTLAAALADADAFTVQLWADQFASAITKLDTLAKACRPGPRSVK